MSNENTNWGQSVTAVVIRDGKVQTINKDDLVVGDLVCIGMGQEIFADGYIVSGKVSVNNAAINGETKECKKTPIDEYVHQKTTSTDAYTNQNCLFAGTSVMSGEGKMIVTDVGVNTCLRRARGIPLLGEMSQSDKRVAVPR